MVSEGRTRKARPSNDSKIPWKSVWLKYTAGEEMRSVTVSSQDKNHRKQQRRVQTIWFGRTKMFEEWTTKDRLDERETKNWMKIGWGVSNTFQGTPSSVTAETSVFGYENTQSSPFSDSTLAKQPNFNLTHLPERKNTLIKHTHRCFLYLFILIPTISS